MVATQNYEDYVRTAIEAGADLIISGAGLPVTLPDIAAGASSQGRSHSVKLAPIVSSLKSANVIFKYWMKKYDYLPDMVVSSLAIRLSRIPVRLTIHSSEVSILVDSQSFVTFAAGRQLPVPIILLFIYSSSSPGTV